MRIVLVGPSLLMPWTDYTARALKRLGQSVLTFYGSSLTLDRLTLRKGRQLAGYVPGGPGLLDRCRAAWHRARDRRLLRTVEKARPDLILVLWGNTLGPELLRSLKAQAGCPLVTWWLDDPFRHSLEDLLPSYDIFFVFDRSYMTRLVRAGASDVRFLPCACDETVYRPETLTRAERARYRSDIALVAWYYARRAEVVNALDDFDLKIWGRGWRSAQARQSLGRRWRGTIKGERFISDRETAKIYCAAKIGLNIHSEQSHEAGLNTRSFELLAAGAFELVDSIPGMDELLEPGREVAVYASPEEARELADHYLRHEAQRIDIARRGRERTLREHTYVNRMRTLLQAVGGY